MKTNSSTTIGLDLGDLKHAVCVLSRGGKVWRKGTIGNNRAARRELSRKHPRALIVMEVEMQSPWVSRYFQELGHRVLVANATTTMHNRRDWEISFSKSSRRSSM